MKTLAKAMAGCVLVALFVLMGACSDDFGTPCNFPSAPEIDQYCDTQTDDSGNVTTSTCIDPINPDCESRLCVIYQGSDAFCTERCSSSGGCPGGSRCEFPLGASIGICVPNRIEG